MNDLRHPCQEWAEPISLAAAGCLPPDDEQEVRRHIETCSDCRERFRELAQLCGALSEIRPQATIAQAAIVERVMSAIDLDVPRRLLTGSRTEMIHPMPRTRFLDPWRWIMRSRASRVSAVAVLVLAVLGAALWFHGGGATPAFADFVAPILEAKTARFKIRSEVKGPPAVTTTGKVLVLDATRSRQEMEIELVMPDAPATQKPAKSRMVMIFDWGRGKSLTLDPATKKAVVLSLANLSKEQVAQQDMFGQFRSMLLDARDKPDVQREPLGEMEIDGRRVVGFRVNSKGMVISLWGDPQTGQPVRAEATMAVFANVKVTMSDFEFDVAMDESLFSVEPPAGYTVQTMNLDASAPEEKDLLETFRLYSQLVGGAFPDSLDMQTIMQTVGKMVGMKSAVQAMCDKLASEGRKLTEEETHRLEGLMQKMMDWQSAPGQERPNEEMRETEEQMRSLTGWGNKNQENGKPDLDQIRKSTEAGMKKFVEIQIPLQRGLFFAFALSAEANAHYAGKGVSLGAADTPIFWYRPTGSKTYRVIYADLSVRDVDTPPNVPEAKPIAAGPMPAKQD